MALTFEEQDQLAHDAVFVGRMTQCMLTIAVQLAQEPDTTPGHDERQALSRSIMASPSDWGNRGAQLVVTDPSFTAEASDGDLLSIMYGMLGSIT